MKFSFWPRFIADLNSKTKFKTMALNDEMNIMTVKGIYRIPVCPQVQL